MIPRIDLTLLLSPVFPTRRLGDYGHLQQRRRWRLQREEVRQQ